MCLVGAENVTVAIFFTCAGCFVPLIVYFFKFWKLLSTGGRRANELEDVVHLMENERTKYLRKVCGSIKSVIYFIYSSLLIIGVAVKWLNFEL